MTSKENEIRSFSWFVYRMLIVLKQSEFVENVFVNTSTFYLVVQYLLTIYLFNFIISCHVFFNFILFYENVYGYWILDHRGFD
jgi:hypothetical protein